MMLFNATLILTPVALAFLTLRSVCYALFVLPFSTHFGYLGMEEIQQMRGSEVTQLCQNYGLIDNSVYFTAEEVLGGVPLYVGDRVNALAVRDGAHGGWRALRVGVSGVVHLY